MRISYLLPKSFKLIGLVLLVPGFVLGIAGLGGFEPEWATVNVLALFPDNFNFPGSENQKESWLFQFQENNIINETALILLLVGSIFILFARVKYEDEMMMKFRLESLLWGVRSAALITLVAAVVLYSFTFFYYMILAMFLPLWLASLRFYWSIFKLSRS